jgi:hypothetical protein
VINRRERAGTEEDGVNDHKNETMERRLGYREALHAAGEKETK